MALRRSLRQVARKGNIGSKRHGFSRSRRLGMEALEQRQMLDGAAVGLWMAEGEAGPMPDFVLIDQNSTSATFQQQVSPRDYLGKISAWYLGAAFCGYCVNQYELMDQMQTELQQTHPLLKIELIGINEPNQEAGNATATNGRDIPWLQDTDTNGNSLPDASVDLWGMSFRDVVVLNGANEKIAKTNLNQNDLGNSGNYDTLKALLVEEAMKDQRPWRNPVNARDVNNSGFVVPLDVLLIINELNLHDPRLLPPPTSADSPPPFWDANGDGFLTAADALFVINYLNSSQSGFSQGEGEPSPMQSMAGDASGLADLALMETQPSVPVTAGSVIPSVLNVDLSFDSPLLSATIAPDDANRISAVDQFFTEQAAEDRAMVAHDSHSKPVFEELDLLSLLI